MQAKHVHFDFFTALEILETLSALIANSTTRHLYLGCCHLRTISGGTWRSKNNSQPARKLDSCVGLPFTQQTIITMGNGKANNGLAIASNLYIDRRVVCGISD